MQNTKRQGFTLIEVLIALCIIAIALTAAVRATTQSARATTHLRTTLTAHWVGLNILSEIQTGMIPLSDILPGKSDMLGKTWTWQASVAPSQDSPALHKITVTVKLDDHVVNTVVGYV
jgi:general secretion pathway protein I